MELRKPFDRIDNPYFWAAILDLLDLLGWVPVLGEAIDIIQGVAALIIFAEPIPVLIAAGVELALPGPLDLFPSYVAAVYVLNREG
ncbi:MAG: hypothetical protein WC483_02950 [Candidatus Paceibacterota bacterium]